MFDINLFIDFGILVVLYLAIVSVLSVTWKCFGIKMALLVQLAQMTEPHGRNIQYNAVPRLCSSTTHYPDANIFPNILKIVCAIFANHSQ